jgi:replicative DNA helicase
VSLDAKIIHAILAEKDLGAVLSAGITTEWFEDPISSAAYAKILDYSKLTDASGQVPGRSYLEQLGLVPFGEYDGSETLIQLVEAKRLDRLRKLIMSATGDITGTIFSDPEGSLQTLLKGLNSKEIQSLTTHGRKSSLQSLTPTLLDWYSTSLSTSGVTGIHTPFPALTDCIKGWQRGEMYCLYAPVKSYKSWILFACAVEAYKRGTGNILIITSEMPSEQCAVRMLCLLNNWSFGKYRDRKLPLPVVQEMLNADQNNRIHFYQPSGFDEQAIGEIRAEVQRLNTMGGVDLILWDGHYRSASSEDWECVYRLVRMTRALALEKEINQPPIILTTQEGSQKGQASRKAYSQEASLMAYISKLAMGLVMLQTTAVREGPSVELEISVNLEDGVISQLSAKSETDESSGVSGGLL